MQQICYLTFSELNQVYVQMSITSLKFPDTKRFQSFNFNQAEHCLLRSTILRMKSSQALVSQIVLNVFFHQSLVFINCHLDCFAFQVFLLIFKPFEFISRSEPKGWRMQQTRNELSIDSKRSSSFEVTL